MVNNRYTRTLLFILFALPFTAHAMEPLHAALVSGVARRLIHSAPHFLSALRGATHRIVVNHILQVPHHVSFTTLPNHIQEFLQAHQEEVENPPALLEKAHNMFKYIHLEQAHENATLAQLLFTPVDTLAELRARRDIFMLKQYLASIKQQCS